MLQLGIVVTEQLNALEHTWLHIQESGKAHKLKMYLLVSIFVNGVLFRTNELSVSGGVCDW